MSAPVLHFPEPAPARDRRELLLGRLPCRLKKSPHAVTLTPYTQPNYPRTESTTTAVIANPAFVNLPHLPEIFQTGRSNQGILTGCGAKHSNSGGGWWLAAWLFAAGTRVASGPDHGHEIQNHTIHFVHSEKKDLKLDETTTMKLKNVHGGTRGGYVRTAWRGDYSRLSICLAFS